MQRTDKQLNNIINKMLEVKTQSDAEALLISLTVNELFRLNKLKGLDVKREIKKKLIKQTASNIIGVKYRIKTFKTIDKLCKEQMNN
jgi:hypothetical protein